jgi:HPt (histidine-containing phosphotransfer) domain-containing protein
MDGYISKPIQAEELLKLTEALAADAGPIDRIEEPAHGVLDRNLALARVDGDEVLLGDLAKLFLEEIPKMLAAVWGAVSGKDADRLQRAAHSLKGSVATLAAQKAFDAALKLERLARARDLEDSEKVYAMLAYEIERLKPVLETLSAGRERAPEVGTT